MASLLTDCLLSSGEIGLFIFLKAKKLELTFTCLSMLQDAV